MGFSEEGKVAATKRDITEIERMLRALINTLENKHLTP